MTTAANATNPPVDIVVPIYNARTDVERCVESILRHAKDDWRFVLVDDCSTDSALVEFLQRAAANDSRIVLIRCEKNGGFVITANRGMRQAAGRDVILLNSDTVVTESFISKLAACAYATEPPAIVSPLTNNGTICSVPEFCRDNELPKDLSIDEYGRLVADISFRSWPELVTAVGFCMYVPDAVFKRIGYFDEEHFGRGFGEENDFCERAKAAGFPIRLCDDLFIAHTGKASFGDEGRALERVNSKTMDRMHPRYFADVAEFCARNPLRDIHENVKYHLGRHRARHYPAMMFLIHSTIFGEGIGGAEHLVADLIAHLRLPRAIVVFPDGNDMVVAEMLDGNLADVRLHRISTPGRRPFFVLRDPAIEAIIGKIVELWNIQAAHVHHFLHWPIGTWRVLREMGIPYCYSIHDYYCVCPSWNLVNRDTNCRCNCDPKQTGEIRECIVSQYSALGLRAPQEPVAALQEHRREFAELLNHAAGVIAPSQSALDIVRHHYPELNRPMHVIGHGYDVAGHGDEQIQDANAAAESNNLRVALLGQIAYPHKGADDYVRLLQGARELPIQWHVFGDTDVYGFGRGLQQLGLGDRLRLHGPYRREDICTLLRNNSIDVTVLLPKCDETFCFTLSESWLAGIPAIVSNCGALPERAAQTGAALVVQDATEALEKLRGFLSNRAALSALTDRAGQVHHATLQENAEAHRNVFGPLWNILTTPGPALPIGPKDRELFGLYRQTSAASTVPAATAPSYHSSWWYPHYLRIKPYVPVRVRGWAKEVYRRVK
jgi:GT2 family glycosyltransferase/glycosyltransferase involved in cell wall biosynthesis